MLSESSHWVSDLSWVATDRMEGKPLWWSHPPVGERSLLIAWDPERLVEEEAGSETRRECRHLTTGVPHAHFVRGPSPITVWVGNASYIWAATGHVLSAVPAARRR